MRREWSSWIKARQWSEFEKLAKEDPSQSLADTIAELELGFPEKTDKRALRKVLYLLSQSGIEPREIEEFAHEVPAPTPPIEVAFMVSSDGLGDSIITYGREEKGRVHWLVAHINARTGVTRAVEDATTLDETHTKLIRLRNMVPTPYVAAEIPLEFAFSRLAEAISITKSLPPVMAYWRSSLPKQILPGHPTDSMPRAKVTEEDFEKFLSEDPSTQSWRLELGSLAPTVMELTDSRVDGEESAPIDKEKWNAVMDSTRKQLFSEEVIKDHRLRLLDLAYLHALKGATHCNTILALADDLLELGSESFYAKQVSLRSLMMYMHALKAANSKSRERVQDNNPRS